jgi:predicted SAM-dependent methyltransferase
MKLLNLGCGSRYHAAWTNVDFTSSGTDVLAHNLLKGIPFADQSFDVVYHSHVLEHFSKDDGNRFLKECYRVLKPNGILRVAVPDLERIVKEYLRNLELALQGDENAANNYDWIKLELYDQAVRNEAGGDMAKYIFQKTIPNEEYIYTRIGEEGRRLRKAYLEGIAHSSVGLTLGNKENKSGIFLRKLKSKIKGFLLKRETNDQRSLAKETAVGKFRLGGEVHQWMYDRYSLYKILTEIGFSNIEVKDAFHSAIPDWEIYELESIQGTVLKPDSLFMEAVKR